MAARQPGWQEVGRLGGDHRPQTRELRGAGGDPQARLPSRRKADAEVGGADSCCAVRDAEGQNALLGSGRQGVAGDAAGSGSRRLKAGARGPALRSEECGEEARADALRACSPEQVGEGVPGTSTSRFNADPAEPAEAGAGDSAGERALGPDEAAGGRSRPPEKRKGVNSGTGRASAAGSWCRVHTVRVTVSRRKGRRQWRGREAEAGAEGRFELVSGQTRPEEQRLRPRVRRC
ncbi:uncharacterized protein LOC123950909 [Meles meles]|uniref:uncharacterized protein LOC123950909 n=1 Tax=Meles meles TaxID=9662 RepID=UPI001E69B613|nr:uncharacterized protein LOC123950909 [Meles meles]